MTACPVCDRPKATQAEWDTVEPGERSDLCWGDPACYGARVDWRARAIALADGSAVRQAKAREADAVARAGEAEVRMAVLERLLANAPGVTDVERMRRELERLRAELHTSERERDEADAAAERIVALHGDASCEARVRLFSEAADTLRDELAETRRTAKGMIDVYRANSERDREECERILLAHADASCEARARNAEATITTLRAEQIDSERSRNAACDELAEMRARYGHTDGMVLDLRRELDDAREHVEAAREDAARLRRGDERLALLREIGALRGSAGEMEREAARLTAELAETLTDLLACERDRADARAWLTAGPDDPTAIESVVERLMVCGTGPTPEGFADGACAVGRDDVRDVVRALATAIRERDAAREEARLIGESIVMLTGDGISVSPGPCGERRDAEIDADRAQAELTSVLACIDEWVEATDARLRGYSHKKEQRERAADVALRALSAGRIPLPPAQQRGGGPGTLDPHAVIGGAGPWGPWGTGERGPSRSPGMTDLMVTPESIPDMTDEDAGIVNRVAALETKLELLERGAVEFWGWRS